MDTVTIVIAGTLVLGVTTALAIFIHQLLLSRDKRLNDKAQQRALRQEAKELDSLRQQMEKNKRFDAHYRVLGDNKEAIQYFDLKIEEILTKKMALIQRYSKMAVKESETVVSAGIQTDRKQLCEHLQSEIEQEIAFYDKEIAQLQKRRAGIWDRRVDLQNDLLEQEKLRNKELDGLYHRHSDLLGKIYIRHNENSENIAGKVIDASSRAFGIITTPIQLLFKYLNISPHVSPEHFRRETLKRENINRLEEEINNSYLKCASSSGSEKKQSVSDFVA